MMANARSRWLAVRGESARVSAALPCLPLAAGLVNGAIWTLKLDSAPIWPLAALCLPGILIAGAILKGRALLGFAVCTLLGLLSAQLNGIVPASDYTNAIGGREACGAIVEARVADASCCGEALPWLPNPKYVRMEVLKLKLSPAEDWQPASGLFAARLPDDFKPEYGATVQLSGAFLLPEAPASEASFDFRRYLELHSVKRVFEAGQALGVEPGRGFMHGIFAVRNAALQKLCEGLKNDDSKRLVAALVFGCQQGVSWESRKDFLRSGTIHILSVSGLHVAMAAALIALALRAVPFRLRHLLIPLLTLLYALSTGMQAPSFRAFAMLAVWSLLRAALLSTSAMNSVLLAGTLLLLWQPAQLLDNGFQYSFLCVIFLLASAPLFREWMACGSERLRWTPFSHSSRVEWLKLKALETFWLALGSCVVAWLASCGLTLLYQGIGAPLSIPANMLLIPVTWGIFGLFALQALLFWIPGFMAASGFCMERLLETMNGICAFFASYGGGSAPMAPLWSVVALLTLLALALAFRGRRATLVLAASIAALLALWFNAARFEKPELAVLHGGASQELSIAVSDPRSGFALVINAPDFDAARQLSAYLASRGVDSANALLASSASKGFCAGGRSMLSFLKVDELAIPQPNLLAETAQALCGEAVKRGIPLRILAKDKAGEAFIAGPLWQAALKKRGFRVECSAPGMDIVLLQEEIGLGLRMLEVKGADGTTLYKEIFVNSLERKLQVFLLGRQ